MTRISTDFCRQPTFRQSLRLNASCLGRSLAAELHSSRGYPKRNQAERKCARELVGVALAGAVDMDWDEVLRVANLPEYRNVAECRSLVSEVANELKIESPFHSD